MNRLPEGWKRTPGGGCMRVIDADGVMLHVMRAPCGRLWDLMGKVDRPGLKGRVSATVGTMRLAISMCETFAETVKKTS